MTRLTPATAIERVTLVRPDESFLSQPGWLALVAFVLICLVLGAAISRYAWRDRRLATPEERAFRVLARAMGLARADLLTLRSLARHSGLPEMTLAMSPGAFDHAATEAKLKTAEELRRRLFSDRSP